MALATGISWRMRPFSITAAAERLSPTQRLILFAGVLLFLGGGFYVLVYAPKTKTIQQLQGEVETLERRLALASAKSRNIEAFQAELAQTKALLRESLRMLPNKREIPELLKTITRLGREARLEFPLFSPQEERPKDFYVEIPVSMVMRGEYRSIALFFYKVAHMNRIVAIRDVSLRPESELSNILLGSCTAITYRFEEKAGEKQAEKRRRR